MIENQIHGAHVHEVGLVVADKKHIAVRQILQVLNAVNFGLIHFVQTVPDHQSEQKNHQSLEDQRGAEGVAFE